MKKTTWVFLFQKYGKFWSVSVEFFVEHKPWNCEEWSWWAEHLSIERVCNFTVFLVVSQEYSTKAEDEYVMKGNDVLIRCKIPTFVADFVQVIGWIDNDHKPILPDGNNSNFFSQVYALLPACCFKRLYDGPIHLLPVCVQTFL